MPGAVLETSPINEHPAIRGWPLFWLLQCAGWLAYGIAMFAWGLDYFSTVDALVNKALLAGIGFALTLGLRLLYRRLRGRSQPPLRSAWLIFVVSFAGAAVWRESHTLLFEIYRSSRGGNVSISFVGIPLGTWLYDGLVLLAWSLLYYGLNDWIEIERQRERAIRAEAMAQQARLRALQSQLEPHFLFNTLNAISTLVAEGQNSDAVRMISRVSDFLRLTLDANETPEISVAEELEFVRRYLDIEQVRFGDRLRVTIEAQPEAMSAMVPALVLQPLVENAVKHGVLPRERGGAVLVTIALDNGTLRMAVTDDGPGVPNDSEVRHGVGLANTTARLAELYGSRARFSVTPSTQGGVAAVIDLPFRATTKRPAPVAATGVRR